MAKIIEYPQVLQRLTSDGLRCNYHNSGAFGFPPSIPQHIRGWIGPDDPSIKPSLQPSLRKVPSPYEKNLSDLATRAWQQIFPGIAWLLPLSHWAFELADGSRSWMPQLLGSLNIDSAALVGLNTAVAIELAVDEADAFCLAVGGLLEHLSVSDFLIAFPGRPVVCTLHHHKQLWWVTTQTPLLAQLDTLLPPD